MRWKRWPAVGVPAMKKEPEKEPDMDTLLWLIAAFVAGALAGHYREELKALAKRAVAKYRAWRATR